MTDAAAALRRDSRVLRADVFRGLVRPPDGNLAGGEVPEADFDAVLLIETRTVGDASSLREDDVVARLIAELAGDRLGNVIPALLFKRSFRTFVLRVFADDRVTPNPVLYRRHNPVDRE